MALLEKGDRIQKVVFGPFYPDKSQPAGNYTWKAWLLEPKSMAYQDKVVTFTYG